MKVGCWEWNSWEGKWGTAGKGRNSGCQNQIHKTGVMTLKPTWPSIKLLMTSVFCTPQTPKQPQKVEEKTSPGKCLLTLHSFPFPGSKPGPGP